MDADSSAVIRKKGRSVCACMCVHACVCMHVCACMCARVCVFECLSSYAPGLTTPGL